MPQLRSLDRLGASIFEAVEKPASFGIGHIGLRFFKLVSQAFSLDSPISNYKNITLDDR
jgi:hypothetical protein